MQLKEAIQQSKPSDYLRRASWRLGRAFSVAYLKQLMQESEKVRSVEHFGLQHDIGADDWEVG